MQNKSIIKKLIIPILLFVILLIGVFVYPFNNKLTVSVIYGDVMNGSGMKVYYDKGSGLIDSDSRFDDVSDCGASVTLKHYVKDLNEIAIALTDIEEVCNVRQISLSVDDGEETVINANEIDGYFTVNDAAGYYDEATGMYYFLPSGDNPCLVMNHDVYSSMVINKLDVINSGALRTRVLMCVLFAVILSLIVLKYKDIETYLMDMFDTSKGIFAPIAFMAFIVGTIVVFLIAFRSDLGGVHPDEYDVVECLKYGMNHIIPPDMRADDVAVTYSGYGYTKLENGTYYFLIAGKIAALAKYLYAAGNWWRVPNVILFMVMAYIFVKNIKKKNFLVLALGISVQSFYIFSYTTADALDFFFAFLVLMLLTDEESMLNRIIRDGVFSSSRNIVSGVLIGVLFGMVFIGKQNYWAILVLAFVALLFKLIRNDKDTRSGMIKTYIFILAVFIVTVGTRYGFDMAHYGMQKAQVKEEMVIKYSAEDRNPNTPAEKLAPTWAMYSHGYKINDLFAESPKWFANSFHSFCGLLDDMETSQAYFSLMGVLYIFVIFTLLLLNVHSERNRSEKAEAYICFGILLLSIVVSIGNSYFTDTQYQGRYLLPMAFTLSYIGYKTPEAFNKKYFRAAVLMINILVVWYLATAGIRITGVMPGIQ